MTVLIRDATPADVPAITGLYNALLATTTITYREEPATEAELSSWLDQRHSDGFPVLVAEDDTGVIGYATYGVFRGGTVRIGYRHSAELTIHVAGTHHGQGVGRALMEALIEVARQRGIHVLIAGIDSSNVESIEFHRRLGFVETARMPEVGRKFDRWLTLVLMQRILD